MDSDASRIAVDEQFSAFITAFQVRGRDIAAPIGSGGGPDEHFVLLADGTADLPFWALYVPYVPPFLPTQEEISGQKTSYLNSFIESISTAGNHIVDPNPTAAPRLDLPAGSL